MGRKKISVPWLRPLLRDLLRWWSLRLRPEKFFDEAPRGARREKNCPSVCTNRSFMLWSGLMSAEPRSDRRVDQGEEHKKGKTKKGSGSTSRTLIMTRARRGEPSPIGARARHHAGSIATDLRSPHRVHFLLLPVSGRAGARASTIHVALTRVRRRRIASSGRPGESC